MKIIALKNKHLSAFTRAIRELKPENVDNITRLPDAEFYEAAIEAAYRAGWLEDVTREQVDDLTYKQAETWATDIWKAWTEARTVDPN